MLLDRSFIVLELSGIDFEFRYLHVQISRLPPVLHGAQVGRRVSAYVTRNFFGAIEER